MRKACRLMRVAQRVSDFGAGDPWQVITDSLSKDLEGMGRRAAIRGHVWGQKKNRWKARQSG